MWRINDRFKLMFYAGAWNIFMGVVNFFLAKTIGLKLVTLVGFATGFVMVYLAIKWSRLFFWEILRGNKENERATSN